MLHVFVLAVLVDKNVPVWLDRYKDALVLLLSEVLNRIQFRYNQAQLEELDDETLDDDVRTFYILYIPHTVTSNFSFVMFSVSLVAINQPI